MAPLDDEIAALVPQITAAFRDVLRGDGTSLHETIVLDDYGDEEDRQEARARDTDTHWWEIPEGTMHHHEFFFSYLDGRGLRYYLPAWMIRSLKHFRDPPDKWTNTMSDILSVLTLSDRPDLVDWKKAKWEILTREQSQVICRYLRCVASSHRDEYKVGDAAKALRRHWGQFCGNDLTAQTIPERDASG